MESLWHKDTNRVHSSQLALSWQDHTQQSSNSDNAPNRLFERLDPIVLQKPTYDKLLAMYDNYFAPVGRREHRTRQEREVRLKPLSTSCKLFTGTRCVHTQHHADTGDAARVQLPTRAR